MKMRNWLKKWLVVLFLGLIVYLVMSKAVFMIIAGNDNGKLILYVIAIMAAANIYDEIREAFKKS